MDIFDICPQPEKIRLGDKEIPVNGISAKGVAQLLDRFPVLMKLLSRQETVEPVSIISIAPDAVVAIIAAGLGKLGDEQVEKAIENWPLEAQKEAIKAIGRLTFPSGLRPFLADLDFLTNSVVPAGVEVSPLKSPLPPKPLEPQDTQTSGI